MSLVENRKRKLNNFDKCVDYGTSNTAEEHLTDNEDFAYLFVDYTLDETNTNIDTDTTKLLQKFNNSSLFQKAVPNTWLYNKICTSTPLLASKILTQNLKVVSVTCAYMEPAVNEIQTFCMKKK